MASFDRLVTICWGLKVATMDNDRQTKPWAFQKLCFYKDGLNKIEWKQTKWKDEVLSRYKEKQTRYQSSVWRLICCVSWNRLFQVSIDKSFVLNCNQLLVTFTLVEHFYENISIASTVLSRYKIRCTINNVHCTIHK